MPGNEFGATLDPDLDADQPVDGFEEYAKAPHTDSTSNSSGGGSDTVNTGRKDGRAELLVIGRQDWISTLKCSRYRSTALTVETEIRLGLTCWISRGSKRVRQ